MEKTIYTAYEYGLEDGYDTGYDVGYDNGYDDGECDIILIAGVAVAIGAAVYGGIRLTRYIADKIKKRKRGIVQKNNSKRK